MDAAATRSDDGGCVLLSEVMLDAEAHWQSSRRLQEQLHKQAETPDAI